MKEATSTGNALIVGSRRFHSPRSRSASHPSQQRTLRNRAGVGRADLIRHERVAAIRVDPARKKERGRLKSLRHSHACSRYFRVLPEQPAQVVALVQLPSASLVHEVMSASAPCGTKKNRKENPGGSRSPKEYVASLAVQESATFVTAHSVGIFDRRRPIFSA
jgi:hypothetical protein